MVDQQERGENQTEFTATQPNMTQAGACTEAVPMSQNIKRLIGGILMKKAVTILIAGLLILAPATLAVAEEAPQK